MRKLSLLYLGLTSSLLSYNTALAQVGHEVSSPAQLTEVVQDQAPEFLLGKPTRPNFEIKAQDNPDMSVSLGIRVQGTAEYNSNKVSDTTDFFLRRMRFEMKTQFSKRSEFVLDIRNDNANKADQGERQFNIGDAYFATKNIAGSSLLNFKAYRAKIDVSRSETIKSSQQVYYDRASVADEAAQFVSHNRRAANAQFFGNYKKKIHYSAAVGDGVNSRAFHDASGDTASSIVKQNPMIGGKLILSPIDGWEEVNRTETYFARGKHAEVGVGYFSTANIRFVPVSGGGTNVVDRRLLNVEASAHYENLFAQFEFFRFYDVVENYSAANLNIGTSSGWYLESEYVLPQLAYIAPFLRYEYWNRFDGTVGYLQISKAAGLNWYLRGNTVRTGFVVQRDEYGGSIGETDQTVFKILSQLHF